MRVCLICNEYPPAPHGGIGSMSRDLAEGLAAKGLAMTVLGTALRLPIPSREDGLQNGVRVIRIPRAPVWWPEAWRDTWHRLRLRRTLVRLHRAQPFDLIEAPDYQGWMSSGPLPGVPLLVRMNGANFFFDTELARVPNLREHHHEFVSLRRATHLAASSRFAARRHLELAGLADRACEVIPNSVDATFFSPDPTVPVEPGLLLYVNSLNPKKGIEQLLDAANLLLPRRPQARLVVVGGDNMRALHGKYLEQLQARVSPDLRARVDFAGRLPREQVLDWMRRAAICIFPSHMETFGIAPAEAMAVGRPVIYSRTGPGPELIDDGVNGLLCDPYSPADLAEKITRLLDHPDLAARLGEAARQRVLQLCDTRHWLDRNADFYQRCIAGPLNAGG